MPLNIKNQITPLSKASNEWQAVSLMIMVEDYVFFIKRSMNMPTFKGHVAFIGGMRKANELIHEVCLREFEEETFISHEKLNILGCMKVVNASSSLAVLPVLCSLDMKIVDFFNQVNSNGEWDECFAVKLNYIFESKWHFARWFRGDSNYKLMFLDIESKHLKYKIGSSDRYLLWGVTARIVANFKEAYINQNI